MFLKCKVLSVKVLPGVFLTNGGISPLTAPTRAFQRSPQALNFAVACLAVLDVNVVNYGRMNRVRPNAVKAVDQ